MEAESTWQGRDPSWDGHLVRCLARTVSCLVLKPKGDGYKPVTQSRELLSSPSRI